MFSWHELLPKYVADQQVSWERRQKVRRLMQLHHLTCKQAGEIVGVSPKTISNMTTGYERPAPVTEFLAKLDWDLAVLRSRRPPHTKAELWRVKMGAGTAGSIRHLKFFGASDDLFEIEGGRLGEPTEIDPSRAVLIMNDDGGLVVTAHYDAAGTGCWAIGVSQIEDDAPLPDWRIWFTTGAPSRGYSVVLNVEAPPDAVMSIVEKT